MRKKRIIIVVCGIIKKGDRFLLTQRAKPSKLKGKWQFPGGEVQSNETILDGLKREMKEETAIEIKNPIFLGQVWEYFREKYHLVFLCFYCQMKNPNQKIFLDKETKKYGWFRYEEIKKLDFIELTDEFARTALRF